MVQRSKVIASFGLTGLIDQRYFRYINHR